jgi:tetratricopeptide (TPR) repeat protein
MTKARAGALYEEHDTNKREDSRNKHEEGIARRAREKQRKREREQKQREKKMSTMSVDPIEKEIKADNWALARKLIRKELRTSPTDHWLLAMLALTHYEQREYQKALEISQEALGINDKCPLVLWGYAGALDMVGRHGEARKMWHTLIRREVNSLAFGDCGEGIGWAKALINDCRYRIGTSYARQERFSSAMRWIGLHLQHRKPGIRSAYSTEKVRRSLAQITEEARVHGK